MQNFTFNTTMYCSYSQSLNQTTPHMLINKFNAHFIWYLLQTNNDEEKLSNTGPNPVNISNKRAPWFNWKRIRCTKKLKPYRKGVKPWEVRGMTNTSSRYYILYYHKAWQAMEVKATQRQCDMKEDYSKLWGERKLSRFWFRLSTFFQYLWQLRE